MNTTLCENCFPHYADHEQISRSFHEGCAECGTRDKIHTFRGDPRPTPQEISDAMSKAFWAHGPVIDVYDGLTVREIKMQDGGPIQAGVPLLITYDGTSWVATRSDTPPTA